MGYLIGADIGSQSVKAILLDPDGREIGSAGQACTMSHPASGWAEQDPAHWRAGLAAVVRRLLSETAVRAAEVTHLGLASQVDGVVAVDERIRPLRPAIIWLDRRASEQAAALASRLGTDPIFATTGLNADASHIAPKLMWLREHEPDTFRAARCFPPAVTCSAGSPGSWRRTMRTPPPRCCTTYGPVPGTTPCWTPPGSIPASSPASGRPARWQAG